MGNLHSKFPGKSVKILIASLIGFRRRDAFHFYLGLTGYLKRGKVNLIDAKQKEQSRNYTGGCAKGTVQKLHFS